MKICIVDTNILLRFFVGDQKEHHAQTKIWFEEARAGQRSLSIQPIIVAETVFVLESFYKKQRAEIATVFQAFLAESWLHIPDRSVLLDLWPVYVMGLHFVDAYLLSWSKENKAELLTFDKQLKKLSL